MLRSGGEAARTAPSRGPEPSSGHPPCSAPWTRRLEAAAPCEGSPQRRRLGSGRPKPLASSPSPVLDGEMPVSSGRGMPEGDRVWPMWGSSSAYRRRRCRQPWDVGADSAAEIRGRLHGLQGNVPTCKIVGGAGPFRADSEVKGGLALAGDDFALIGTCMPATGWTATGKLRRNAVEIVIRPPMGAPTVCERFVVRRQNSA